MRKLILAGGGLVLLVAALLIWRGAAGPGGIRLPFRGGRSNLLIVSIDTLRADRLGSYGYAAAQTPHLDALASRGLRFADATTVAPLTLPAHTSLFTGTFPAFHGVRDNGGFYVADEQVTLAEVLREQGYRTGGFVGAFVLDARWGINQGFEQYFDDFDLSKATGAGMDTIQRPANDVVDQAIAWLGEDSERPFFAWVHLYDPHAPYLAPEAYRTSFPPTLSGAYDAEVAFTDAQLGRLLSQLSDAGRLDRTAVIVLADHGESLGDHNEQTHGFFIYDSTLRIPLIIAAPGLPARVVTDQVRIVDVMPTALELLGVPSPSRVQGQSLLPASRGERLDLPALGECWFPRYHYGWSELTSLREGRYKFVLAPRRELYDLARDPAEQVNIADANPARAAALEQALQAMMARTASASAAKGPGRIDPDVEERLRALGYVGGSVSARKLEDRARKDPKDTIVLYHLLKAAGQDSVDGRIDDAIAKVKQALAADPEIVEGYTMLGNLHVKVQRYPEAVEAYRRALALDSEHLGATFSLALAYKNMGRVDDAEAGFGRSLELDPRSGKAQWQLADIYMRRGDFQKAEQRLREALELEIDRAPFLVKLGECYVELRRYEEAEARLREALKIKPTIERAHYDLALVHEARGNQADAATEYEAEVNVNPAMYSASFNLAKLLAASGRGEQALRRFREAVASNPEFAPGYLYLAKALLDAGDLPAAEQAARKGLSLRPDGKVAPLGHYVLADVYSRLGRPRDAAREVAAARNLERAGF